LIGSLAALVNFSVFLILISSGLTIEIAAPTAFVTAAIVNYFLCISILFRHKARWNSKTEIFVYIIVVALAGLFDLMITKFFVSLQMPPSISKLIATVSVFIVNFAGRRFMVFPEPASRPWKPQDQQ
jgi:putative flippase GtrA